MNKKMLLDNLRNIPDFPKPGVQFKDVSTLFKNNTCLTEISDTLFDFYKDKGITKVVGIESRGFVMGGILASRLNAGFVMCRKPGKLPSKAIQATYMKEYGEDAIEIHEDAIDSNDVILIHDDLLATGGSMKAAYELISLFKPKAIYVNFLIELCMEGLEGRKMLGEEMDITTLLKIEE
ncbi:adenine phosphoribosyltransferase [Prevotella sp. MGM2]|uniref:adenine phosphoribosyltransferase n=1 Tax=Prevotella sp. MGM2 TaxID=2033406 RepID=UPI000CEA3FBB|nr:adenine phosphoribosyltransferase [Prevotella sp. MGM2]GAY31411.1 adenine phosphoribosyltransferase [Prevotella sp. MGM2]